MSVTSFGEYKSVQRKTDADNETDDECPEYVHNYNASKYQRLPRFMS